MAKHTIRLTVNGTPYEREWNPVFSWFISSAISCD